MRNTIIRQLQKSDKFRNILKKHKIGWRTFVNYKAFGIGHPYESGGYKQAVCMGKYNGVYDYFICYITITQIDRDSFKLIDVIY